jgi:hypothetical protein
MMAPAPWQQQPATPWQHRSWQAPALSLLGPRPAPAPQAYHAYGNPANTNQQQQQTPSSSTVDPALIAALNNLQLPGTHEWYMDSGASSHMSSDHGNFDSLRPSSPSHSVTIGNGATLPITHVGSFSLTSTSLPLHLRNILVVP